MIYIKIEQISSAPADFSFPLENEILLHKILCEDKTHFNLSYGDFSLSIFLRQSIAISQRFSLKNLLSISKLSGFIHDNLLVTSLNFLSCSNSFNGKQLF